MNGREIQDIEDHVEAARTVSVNRMDFHPLSASGDRKVDRGVYIPPGAQNTDLWAAVTLPHDAIINGFRARILDRTGSANLRLELYQVAPNGVRELYGSLNSLSSSTSVRSFSGLTLFRSTDDNVTYEIRAVRDDAGGNWDDVHDDLQLVGVFVDYETEVLFTAP